MSSRFIVFFGLLLILSKEFFAQSFSIQEGDSIEICSLGFPFALNSTGGFQQYEWSNGGTSSSTMINGGGIYWVSATDNSGVTLSDTIIVFEKPVSTEVMAIDRVYFCESDTPYIIFSNEIFAANGFWNDGNSGSINEVYFQGKYWYTYLDSIFCLNQADTIDLVVLADGVELNLSKVITVCDAGFPYDLAVELGDNPIWQDSSVDYVFSADSAGVYWYESDFGGCAKVFDTITLNFKTIVAPVLCCDTSVCAPDTIFLSLPTGFVDYFWSTGQNAPSIYISKIGVFDVSVTVTDSTNCSAVTNVIRAEVKDSIPNISISENGNFLVVQPAGFSYQWFRNDSLLQGQTLQATEKNIRGIYCVKVSQGVCFDTICFSYLPPIVNFLEDYTANDLEIFPNPATTFFELNASENARVRVFDFMGKLAVDYEDNGGRFDVPDLPGGLYNILIETGRAGVMKRLVILK